MGEKPTSPEPTPWAPILGFGVFAGISLVMFLWAQVPMSPSRTEEGLFVAIVLFLANIGLLVVATFLALMRRTRQFGKGALIASGLTLLVVLSNCARYL